MTITVLVEKLDLPGTKEILMDDDDNEDHEGDDLDA